MKLKFINDGKEKWLPYDSYCAIDKNELDPDDIYPYDMVDLIGYGETKEEALEDLKTKVKYLMNRLKEIETNLENYEFELEENHMLDRRFTTRDESGLATLVTTDLNDPCEWCYDAIQKLAYYEDLEETNRKILLGDRNGNC